MNTQVMLPILLLPLLLAFNVLSSETLELELTQLKRLCDKKLMPEEECVTRREQIWDRHKATDEVKWYCNFGGEQMPPEGLSFSFSEEKQFSENASANRAVKEIIDASGLAPNFIVRANGVPNAAAMVRGDQRYIEYNPNFILQLKSIGGTNWAVYSVLAHEIGHHLQGHTLQGGGSRPSIELEADEYSGFILARMGANKEDALVAMRNFGNDSGNNTHPAKADRLEAILRGYNRGLDRKTERSLSESKHDKESHDCDISGITAMVKLHMPSKNIAARCPKVSGAFGCSTRKVVRLVNKGQEQKLIERECEEKGKTRPSPQPSPKPPAITNICQTPQFWCQTMNSALIGTPCTCIHPIGGFPVAGNAVSR